jgi:hypothetical protein
VPLGAALAGFCGTPAWAQTEPAPPNGLRPTFDDSGQALPQRLMRPRRAEPPPGVRPRFGNGPGSGAGRTGFNSSNVPTQRTRQPAGTGRDTTVKEASAKKPPPLSPPPTKAARPGKARTAVVAAPPGLPSAAQPGSSGAAPRAQLGAATAPDIAGVVPPSDAVALPPPVVEQPRPRPLPPEDDPLGPTGIHAGTFLLRPALEVLAGYDTNPARVPNAKGSPAFTIAPELVGRSDWERHEFDIAIRGAYYYFPEVSFADRPNLDARANGRIDVSKDTRIDVQGRYLVSTDYPGSPNVAAADLAKLPIYTDLGATLGLGQRFNRLDVSLKGTIDRIDWQDSLLTDGIHQSNADRNYDQYGTRLRGSYEVLPGLKPFAEVDADTRVHDLKIDRTGADRDSDGVAVKAGTTFEFTRTLTGEISVGYLNRYYVDPTLPNIHAPLLDAALIWAATGLTTVKFAAKTTVDESVLQRVSGVLRHDNGIEISHALRRWLIATTKFGYEIDDYIGSFRQDHRYVASLAMTYKISRDLWFKSELREEWLSSNVPNSNYWATIALIGLRLQR